MSTSSARPFFFVALSVAAPDDDRSSIFNNRDEICFHCLDVNTRREKREEEEEKESLS